MNSPWSIHQQMQEHRAGEWMLDAACAGAPDKEIFFPGKWGSTRPAKSVCRPCPVRAECATYALTSPTVLHGVWGGLSENERDGARRHLKNVRLAKERETSSTQQREGNR